MTTAEGVHTVPASIALAFLAEGAANIVYRILPPAPLLSPTSPSDSSSLDFFSLTTPPPSEVTPPPLAPAPPSRYHGLLLRLRKYDPARTTSVLESQKHFTTLIAPLFSPEQVVDSQLVRLPPSLLKGENEALKLMEKEGRRERRRQGVFLDEGEEWGMLVTDMTARSTSIASNLEPGFLLRPTGLINNAFQPAGLIEEEALEFKPKWLVQSPTAPKGARRCRTCALHALREQSSQPEGSGNAVGATVVRKAEGGASPLYCPLKLLSDDRRDVEQAVDGTIAVQVRLSNNAPCSRSSAINLSAAARERVIDHLYQNSLLLRLRDLQVEDDPHGVLESEVDERLLIAMALRDCTLYLKVRTTISQLP